MKQHSKIGETARKKRSRGNRRALYFKKHTPSTRYANLTLARSITPRIIEVDYRIYITNGVYSLSSDSVVTTQAISFGTQTEFTNYATLFSLYRVKGVRLTIWKTGQPVFALTAPTTFEYPILGINVSHTSSQYDVMTSDTTFKVCYIGAWMSKTKVYTFSNILELSQWMNAQQPNHALNLNIGTTGSTSNWSGFNMTISCQLFIEFAQPL